MFVRRITLEPFKISSSKCYGSKTWLKAQTSSEMAAIRCTVARGCDLTCSGRMV